MSDNDFVYKPQDVNYLGFLEAQLRDMAGIDTLGYELIQNADDVQDEDGRFPVTTLSFDVTDEALLVSNDGRFRDLDFERLQSIAGGGKRSETGVTGAFGLGFLAVYQITDAPQIFSAGRHWIIRPDAPADKRIEERQTAVMDTLFRLPWAFDPASPVRRTLRLEPIRPGELDAFAAQLSAAVIQAALFLKRLKRLEVRRSGVPLCHIERQLDGDRLRLIDKTAGGEAAEWLLLSGDFQAGARQMKEQYPWQIEERRQSSLQIAIPLRGRLPAGRLYAGLPTGDTSPLAFHLNADFFPTTDRKRVHFDGGYQAAWNRTAVAAAAAIFPQKLADLTGILGPAAFYHLLQSCFETARQANQGELPDPFAAFWQALLPELPQTAVFYTAAGDWLPPATGRLLPRLPAASAEATLTLLQELQIPVLHPDLAAYAPLLARIGSSSMTAGDIAAGLAQAGLTRGTALSAAPACLRSLSDWQSLWTLLDTLLRGLPPAERQSALAALHAAPLVLTEQLALQPLAQTFRAQPEARALFPRGNWLHPEMPNDSFPALYVPSFGVRQAVDLLAEMSIDSLEKEWRLGRLDLPRLFRWFETMQIEIFADDPALAREIRRLPLCPVDGELRPLADLFLPGGFDDPLQLTNIVDASALGGREEFLRDLGVAGLDFDTYLHSLLPRVLAQRSDLASDRRHRLLELLAARLGEIRDDEELREELGRLPLIPCLDGSFRPATSVYASRQVLELLGTGVHIAEPIESQAQEALYEWLGVREAPGVADLVQALLAAGREWGAAPLEPSILTTVMNCWQAIAESLEAHQITGGALAQLRGQPVIPNGRRVLTAPERLLLADRPDLASQFGAWSAFFLPPDIPWLAAARAVGVRPLSEAVEIAVVDGGKAAASPTLEEHITSRYPLLERLLRAEAGSVTPEQADFLQQIKVMTLANLRIEARLQIGGLEAAEVKAVAAKSIRGVLYLDSEIQPIPWTAVARELAERVIPGRNAGRFALGVKEVLQASSPAAAAAVLDELGYP